MSFPLAPVDGQQAIIGNVAYQFNSSKSAWFRLTGLYDYIATIGNISAGNLIADHFLFANGTPFTTSSYGNTNVAAYLAGNVSTGNISATGYYFANGTPFVSSSYGNTDVGAYLLIDSTITGLQANAATQSVAINTVNANIGSYQTWANATFTTYSNTNTAGYLAGNITTGNVSATGYYFANGTPFVSSSYGNTEVASYLPTYTGNLNPGNITASGNIVGGGVRTTTGAVKPVDPSPGDMWFDTTIDTLFRYTDLGTDRRWVDITGMAFEIKPATIYSNTNVTAYLAGNVTTGNISSAGYYFANGTPFVSSTYGNTEVAAYLAGNITAGNISSASYYFANGAPFSGGGGTNSVAAGYAMIFGGF